MVQLTTHGSKDIILADMVPLRQRGYYLAILLSVFGIGLALGPFIGGAFADRVTWRWVSCSLVELSTFSEYLLSIGFLPEPTIRWTVPDTALPISSCQLQ
jgi:MFS family permease